MKPFIFPARLSVVFMTMLTLGAYPVFAQQGLPVTSGDDAPTVLVMGETVGILRLTTGHSKLLQTDQSIGMIIVGDDTIANTTVGSGNSIVVTGLREGSTNLIVLSKTQELLMSSTIVIAPVAGQLRSIVTVRRGTAAEERYECRDACELIDLTQDRTEVFSRLAAEPGQNIAGEYAAASQ